MPRIPISICLFGLLLFSATSADSQTSTQAAISFATVYGTAANSGSGPNALIQAQDGKIYGTTAAGGSKGCTNGDGITDIGCGVVFRIDPTPSGSSLYQATILYSFTGGVDGGAPTGLIQGGDGNLYITTSLGGLYLNENDCIDDNNNPQPCCVDNAGNNIGCGTIFAISPSSPPAAGAMPVFSFYGNKNSATGLNDGAMPNPLVMGINVGSGGSSQGETQTTFYGTTLACNGCTDFNSFYYGVLFSYTTPPVPGSSGSFDSLFQFTNLAYPNSVLQASDGNLYGTTQLGGNSYQASGTTDCLLPNGEDSAFGCGGVFDFNLSTMKENETIFEGDVISRKRLLEAIGDRSPLSRQPKSSGIVRQPTRGFPVSGWSFTGMPIALTEGSDENIYGTTPPACLTSSFLYTVGPSCQDAPAATTSGLLIQIPLVSAENPVVTTNTLYTFAGNGDGGGSIAGLTLATDGNLYGLTGTDLSADDFFEVPWSDIQNAGTSPLSLKSFTFSSLADQSGLNWMIQANDGTFWATSASGGANGLGAIYQITPSSKLGPPIILNLSPTRINLNSSSTLTWSVPEAYSASAQQCYSFTQNASAGAWSGLQKQSSTTGAPFGGSATITPTGTGTFTYALTCGGTVSSTAILTVKALPLVIASSTPPSGTVGTPYTTTVTASGGVPPYTWAVSSGALPGNLMITPSSDTLSTTISGTPNASGSFSFTLQASDSDSPVATATSNLSIVIAPAAPVVSANPASITIAAPGDSGTTTLSFANFSGGSVTASCAGLPAESTCSLLNPTASTVTLQITTTAPTSAKIKQQSRWPISLAILFPGLVLLLPLHGMRRRIAGISLLIAVVALTCFMAGCGSSMGGGNLGTPTGTSTVTVTLTSGNQAASSQITLNVE